MPPSPLRGEVWLVDLGMAAKTRPCLVLNVPAGDTDRALATLVPHTTSTRGFSLRSIQQRWLPPLRSVRCPEPCHHSHRQAAPQTWSSRPRRADCRGKRRSLVAGTVTAQARWCTRPSLHRIGFSFPTTTARSRRLWPLRRKRDDLSPGLSLLLLQVLADGVQVVIETSGVLVSRFADFSHDGVVNHCHAPQSVPVECRSRGSRILPPRKPLPRNSASPRWRCDGSST